MGKPRAAHISRCARGGRRDGSEVGGNLGRIGVMLNGGAKTVHVFMRNEWLERLSDCISEPGLHPGMRFLAIY